jgi:hypothetical protein
LHQRSSCELSQLEANQSGRQTNSYQIVPVKVC